MARFFFLDQSLKGVGGHHYDYALHVIGAAQELGYQAVLGAHRRFQDDGLIPDGCEVEAVFRHSVYNRFSEFSAKKSRRQASLRDETLRRSSKTNQSTSRQKPARPSFVSRLWQRMKFNAHERGRSRVIRHFADDCRQLFGNRAHQFGDQVFLATISDIELLGLAEYAKHEPTSRLVDWHCQFHFNIFQGRPHEYGSQREMLERCRRRFAMALETLREHHVYLYNTSRELTEQYQQLNVGSFQNLAYPVNPVFAPANAISLHRSNDDQESLDNLSSEPESESSSRPLRVTLAGAIRREKGQTGLTELVDDLYQRLIQPGLISLVVQRKRRSRLRRQQVDLIRELGEMKSELKTGIQYVDHPLEKREYERMLKRADIGLFLYDGRTYYARRAGVLGEFLSLGTPVIVPAGCWLSEQLREPTDRYHATLIEEQHAVAARALDDTHQSLQTGNGDNESEGFVVRGAEPIELQFEIPLGCRRFICRAVVEREGCSSEFLEVQLSTGSSHETSVVAEGTVPLTSTETQFAGVISTTPEGTSSTLAGLLETHSSSTLNVMLRPAFEAPQVSICEFELFAIEDVDCPIGSVGLTAFCRKTIPALLEELQLHHEHYRTSAADFATQWYAKHGSKEVIRQLLSRSAGTYWRAA